MSELSEDPAETAARLNLDLVLPRPDELFIDIDDAASMTALELGMSVLASNGQPVVELKRTTSRSGNTHVYLLAEHFAPMPPALAVAFQACLGSDRKRELLALLRITRGYNIPPRCFFEVKS